MKREIHSEQGKPSKASNGDEVNRVIIVVFNSPKLPQFTSLVDFIFFSVPVQRFSI